MDPDGMKNAWIKNVLITTATTSATSIRIELVYEAQRPFGCLLGFVASIITGKGRLERVKWVSGFVHSANLPSLDRCAR